MTWVRKLTSFFLFLIAVVFITTGCDLETRTVDPDPKTQTIVSVLRDVSAPTIVAVEGVIYGVTEQGVFISDSPDGLIFVNLDPADFTIGDKISVIGTFNLVDGVKPEITEVSEIELISQETPLAPEDDTMETILDADVQDRIGVWYRYVTLTGTITEADGTLMLESDDEKRLPFVDVEGASALHDFVGERVSLPVIVASLHQDNLGLLFVDAAAVIELMPLDDLVAEVASHLDDFVAPLIEVGNLYLPISHENVTGSIYWDTSDEAIITEQGVVKYQNEDQAVTLTARAEIEGVVHTFTYDVTVVGMGNYRMLEDYYQELEAMQDIFGDIAELHVYGHSYEGRPLYALEISSALGVQDGRPEHVHAAAIHAREWASGEVAMELAWHLLENYGHDDRITDLVDDVRIWILPMKNPDGFLKSVDMREASWEPFASGMWRKNTAPNPDGSIGTDLNRNFSYGYGSSGSAGGTSITYWGEAPLSEVETQAYDDFIRTRDVISVIHGHTYLEVIYTDTTHDLTREIAEAMQNYNHYAPRKSWLGGGAGIYTQGVYNMLSWTMEYGKEFIPPYEGYPGPGLKINAFDEVYEAFTMKYSMFLEENIQGTLVYGGYGRSSEIPDSVDGNIALIRRGDGLRYQTKAENALDKGATAVIIFNDEPSLMRLPNIDANNSLPIPVMYMSGAIGEMLADAYHDSMDLESELIAHYYQQDSFQRVWQRNKEAVLIAIEAARDHSSVVTGQLVDADTGELLSGHIDKENDYISPFGGPFEGDYMRHVHDTFIDVEDGAFVWHMTPSDQRNIEAPPYVFTANVEGYHPMIKTLHINDFNEMHTLIFEMVPDTEPKPDDYDAFLDDLALWADSQIELIPETITLDTRMRVSLARDAVERFISFGGEQTSLHNEADYITAVETVFALEQSIIEEIENTIALLSDEISLDDEATVQEARRLITNAEVNRINVDVVANLDKLIAAEAEIVAYFDENYARESALDMTPITYNPGWLADFENRWDDDYTGNSVYRETFEPLRYYAVSHGSLDTNPRYLEFDISERPYDFVEGYVGSSDRSYSTIDHPTHFRIYLDGDIVYEVVNEFNRPANYYRLDVSEASTIRFEFYAPEVNDSGFANRIAFMEPMFLIRETSETDDAIATIESAIDDLPETITLEQESDIDAIRQMIIDAGDVGVTENMIDNLADLEAAEAAIKQLYIDQEAAEVVALIDALPETVTVHDRMQIQEAWIAVSEAYLFGVTFDQITNWDVLEQKYAELDAAYLDSHFFTSLFTLGDPGAENRNSSWLVDYEERWTDWEENPDRTIGGLSFEPLKFYSVAHGSLDTNPRYLQFDISDKDFDYVRGILGIADAPYNSEYPVDFVIYGDGEVLFDARLDYLEPPKFYFLDVSDVTWLRFEWSAEETSPGGYTNRIVFVEPVFLTEETTEIEQAVNDIESAIDALPETITLEEESDIDAIRQMINDAAVLGVTEDLIENLAELEAAEAVIEQLYIDQEAAEVVALIDALAETVTVHDRMQIREAWIAVSQAYLFGATFDQITNLDVLEQKDAELDAAYLESYSFTSLFTLGDPGTENRQSGWLVDYENRWTDWEENPDRTIGGLSFEPLKFYSVAHGSLDTTPRYLQFDISDKDFDYVRGILGIADEPYNSEYPVDFVIYGDGEVLFDARLDYLEPPKFYFLDVSDVTWLRFEWSAEETSPGGYTNRIVFVEPIFLETKPKAENDTD